MDRVPSIKVVHDRLHPALSRTQTFFGSLFGRKAAQDRKDAEADNDEAEDHEEGEHSKDGNGKGKKKKNGKNGKKSSKSTKSKEKSDTHEDGTPGDLNLDDDEPEETEEEKKRRKRRERAEQKARELDASKSPEEKALDEEFRKMVNLKKKIKKEIKQLGTDPGKPPDVEDFYKTADFLHKRLFKEDEIDALELANVEVPATPEETEDQKKERLKKKKLKKMKQSQSGDYPPASERLKYRHKVLQPLSMQMKRYIYKDFKLENRYDDEIFVDDNLDDEKVKIMLDLGFQYDDLYDEETGDPVEYTKRELRDMVARRNFELQFRLGESPTRKWRQDARFLGGERGLLAKQLKSPGMMLTDEDIDREDEEMDERYSDGYAMWVEQQQWNLYYETLADELEQKLQKQMAKYDATHGGIGKQALIGRRLKHSLSPRSRQKLKHALQSHDPDSFPLPLNLRDEEIKQKRKEMKEAGVRHNVRAPPPPPLPKREWFERIGVEEGVRTPQSDGDISNAEREIREQLNQELEDYLLANADAYDDFDSPMAQKVKGFGYLSSSGSQSGGGQDGTEVGLGGSSKTIKKKKSIFSSIDLPGASIARGVASVFGQQEEKELKGIDLVQAGRTSFNMAAYTGADGGRAGLKYAFTNTEKRNARERDQMLDERDELLEKREDKADELDEERKLLDAQLAEMSSPSILQQSQPKEGEHKSPPRETKGDSFYSSSRSRNSFSNPYDFSATAARGRKLRSQMRARFHQKNHENFYVDGEHSAVVPEEGMDEENQTAEKGKATTTAFSFSTEGEATEHQEVEEPFPDYYFFPPTTPTSTSSTLFFEGEHSMRAPPPPPEDPPVPIALYFPDPDFEQNDEDDDQNAEDQEAAIREAMMVSQAQVSGEENENNETDEPSGSRSKDHLMDSSLKKTMSGGLEVIEEGEGEEGMDLNREGSKESVQESRQSGDVYDNADGAGRGAEVNGQLQVIDPAADPLQKSQDDSLVLYDTMVDGRLVMAGEENVDMTGIPNRDREDYERPKSRERDENSDLPSSSASSGGSVIHLKWVAPPNENPDASYRLPRPPLALGVDLDGAIANIKQTKELHAAALEKKQKFGEQMVKKHAPNAKKYLQYGAEVEQILRRSKHSVEEYQRKQYKRKLQRDPPQKTNVRDPASWVKVFHFDTMTTSYWRYEAYNFVLHALDATKDVIPVTKRNFEVFQRKFEEGTLRQQAEEERKRLEEEAKALERSKKRVNPFGKRISFEDEDAGDIVIDQGSDDTDDDAEDYDPYSFFEGKHEAVIPPSDPPIVPRIPAATDTPSASSAFSAGTRQSSGAAAGPSFLPGQRPESPPNLPGQSSSSRAIPGLGAGTMKKDGSVAKMFGAAQKRASDELQAGVGDERDSTGILKRNISQTSSAMLSNSGSGTSGTNTNTQPSFGKLPSILRRTKTIKSALHHGREKRYPGDNPNTEALWGDTNVRYGGSYSPDKNRKLFVKDSHGSAKKEQRQRDKDEQTTAWGGKAHVAEKRQRFDYKAKMKCALMKIKLLRGMGNAKNLEREQQEHQAKLMVLPKALVDEKFLDETKAISEMKTLQHRRELTNVMREEIYAKTKPYFKSRGKRRNSFHVLDPFTGLPLIDTDGERDSNYTDSDEEVDVASPDITAKERRVRRSPKKPAIVLGNMKPGSAGSAGQPPGPSPTDSNEQTVFDSEDEEPAHRRLLTFQQLRGTAMYYTQMRKTEEFEAENVDQKVMKRREAKDGVKLASSKVIVPGTDSASEDEVERKRRVMSRKARKKKSQIVSMEKKMEERRLQTSDHLYETMCGFVEISGETRERMLKQLLGHREVLPGEQNFCQASCCYISYRFFSMLEVISSFEVSARMTEERYMDLFFGENSADKKFQIGSVAITRRIHEILDLADVDPPKPPPINSLALVDQSNTDVGTRLAPFKNFATTEERIVADEWGNLKLEVVPHTQSDDFKLTKLMVKDDLKTLSSQQHYCYVQPGSEQGKLDFLLSLVQKSRDIWGKARKKFEPELKQFINHQVPKIRVDLDQPIVADVFEKVRDEIERTVQQDRLIDLERLEMEREFHKMRVARRKKQEEDRREERRRRREEKNLSKEQKSLLEASRQSSNPYSNYDKSQKLDNGVIGGAGWQQRMSDLQKERDNEDENTSLMHTLNTTGFHPNLGDPRRKELVLSDKTLEELEEDYKEQYEDLSPANRRQRQFVIEQTKQRRFMVGIFYQNSFFQPGHQISYFLQYQHGDGDKGLKVVIDRNRAADFVTMYLEIANAKAKLEYFSNYEETLTKMLRDGGNRIVTSANTVFDRILRQLNLAKQLLQASELLGIPDPEQEVRRLRREREERRIEEDEYQEARRLAGPGEDTPFDEDEGEEEEDSEEEEGQSTDLDSTDPEDLDEEEEPEDFDLSVLLPPIHPPRELNEKNLRREDLERKLSPEKPRPKMIANPDTGKEILAAPRGMKKRMQKALIVESVSGFRAQDKAANTVPDLLDSPEVLSSRGPKSSIDYDEDELEFPIIEDTVDLPIPVSKVMIKKQKRLEREEQGRIKREEEELLNRKKGKKGMKKDLAKMIGTGQVSHISQQESQMTGGKMSNMKDSRQSGLEEEDEEDVDDVGDLDFSKMRVGVKKNLKEMNTTAKSSNVVPFRKDPLEEAEDDPYGEEEEFASLFSENDRPEEGLDHIEEAAESSSCPSDYEGNRQELDYEATIGDETKTLVAQEALRDQKNGAPILAQDIQALLQLAKMRQRTSLLLDVNMKKLRVPSAARQLAIFEHWNPHLDPNPRSLLGLLSMHFFAPPKFYQTEHEARYAVEATRLQALEVAKTTSTTELEMLNYKTQLAVNPLPEQLSAFAEKQQKLLEDREKSLKLPPIGGVASVANKNKPVGGGSKTVVPPIPTHSILSNSGSSLSAVVRVEDDKGLAMQDSTKVPEEEKMLRNCNRYLYDVSKSQDPFATVFADTLEDLSCKLMRFEHRHVGFEMVAHAFPGNFDFASGSRTDQADMLCLLALCKMASTFGD
ncbi:unnamed protein product [Amoebophrya sp. A120]|nr:unnamed protein product [Amoebophrya sp. A120]|eukprot:GSA120T00007718001.1